MSTVQAKLETASQEYQKLQIDLANIVSAGQKLEAQKSENELVKKGWHFRAVGPRQQANSDLFRSLHL
jgi:hypothetical protein